MKVIALRGKNNTGKTTTLNIVYSLLLLKGYTQKAGCFRLPSNSKKDFLDVLTNGSDVIGIATMGDIVKWMQAYLQELEKHQCNIAIVACNVSKKANKIINSYPNHTFVEKTTTTEFSQHRIVNTKDAEQVIEAIP